MHKIVVIITTKNRPRLLEERALKSVDDQSVEISNIVLIDDSDEEYLAANKAVVNRFKSSLNIRYLLNQRTPGVCGATNTGINWVTENYADLRNIYIAVLDDDDEWKDNYLTSCCEIIRKNSKVDWVGTDFYRVENMEEEPILQKAPDYVYADLFLIGNPGIQGSNLFVRLTTLLEAGNFDEHQSASNDRNLCIRLCDLKDVTYARNPHVSMIYYAESNRPRYSNPNTEIKNNGLEKFWLKLHGRMTEVQKTNLIERIISLFNWQPEIPKEQTDSDHLNLKSPIPQVDQVATPF